VFAANYERFDQAYQEISNKLNIPGRDDPQANKLKLVRDWLNDKSHGQWLMILDNADNRSLFFPTIGAKTSYESSTESYLTDYIPSSTIDHGSLVITTRNSDLGTDLANGEDPIDVPHFTPDEAKQLLESKVKPKYWDLKAAEDLINVLDYVPLAIAQASAYMNKRRVHMKKYLKALSESDSNLAAYLTTELLDPRRRLDTPSSVFLTWKLSFDQISEEEPRAAEILSLMAFLDRQRVPEMLLRRGGDLDVKDTNAIGTLQAYSLITAETGDETYSMHRLVQLSTQTWLSLQEKRDVWEGNALELLSREFPNGEHKNRTKCNALLPHAIAVLKYRPTSDSDLLRRANILYYLGWFDWTQGRYKDAITRCYESYSIRQSILGPDDRNTLNSSDLLASAYEYQGRWKEAEELGLQVLETRKRVLGVEHPDTLNGMANLAATYSNQGRWKEAEELEVEVMEMSKRVLGVEHPNTLSTMADLASTCWNQGRLKEAEELEVQVLEMRKRVLGVEHPDTLNGMGNLAATYRHQGRWKEAEELEVQVMEMSKRVLGTEHPNTLNSMANLAATYRNQGRWKEAEELEVQVLEMRKRVLGVEHPDTLNGMANLAATYTNQGRLKEAEELEVQVLEMSKRVLGVEHPNTLNSMANLASTYRNQGWWKEAEELEVQVMEMSKRVLGVEHPDTLNSMANLASTYRNQGRLKEAEDLEVQVLATRKRVLGVEQSQHAGCYGRLGIDVLESRPVEGG
jgi:tetratricopeptide (TPR) repeat protein